MAESTFHLVCDNIMDFLNNLAGSVIKFPETVEEKTEISTQFENVNKTNIFLNYILSIF